MGTIRITNNTGRANNLRRLIPSVSALTNIKILLGGSLKPNPFSRLKNLKKLWLRTIRRPHPAAGQSLQCLSLERVRPYPLVGLRVCRLDVSERRSPTSPRCPGSRVCSRLTSRERRSPTSPRCPGSRVCRAFARERGHRPHPAAGLTSLQSLDVSERRSPTSPRWPGSRVCSGLTSRKRRSPTSCLCDL